MAATNASDDLGEELESAFFGGEIREGEAGVGLNDSDGSEVGKVEPAGEGLGADEDVDGAGLDIVVERSKAVAFLIIAIKTGDFGLREEFRELGFEQLGTKALMDNAGVVTFWAARRDFFGVAAEVTAQGIVVGVESEGEVAVWAKSLPTAVLTDGHWGGTATIMKN